MQHFKNNKGIQIKHLYKTFSIFYLFFFLFFIYFFYYFYFKYVLTSNWNSQEPWTLNTSKTVLIGKYLN